MIKSQEKLKITLQKEITFDIRDITDSIDIEVNNIVAREIEEFEDDITNEQKEYIKKQLMLEYMKRYIDNL